MPIYTYLDLVLSTVYVIILYNIGPFGRLVYPKLNLQIYQMTHLFTRKPVLMQHRTVNARQHAQEEHAKPQDWHLKSRQTRGKGGNKHFLKRQP